MTDSPTPVWKELTIPSLEDRRLFEEWVRQKEEEERLREQSEEHRVIVIDI